MLPLVFNSNSLGGRQKELNDAVNNTKSWNFTSSTENQQDPDVLYKIDLASKFKNIGFLIETLKSGDSLYISRVLKHAWIFDKQYSDIMNPEYLHKEIFPFMSEKMKNKMLTALTIHVKDEDRIQEFCNYCFKNMKKHLGYKFLLYTPVLYKIEMLKTVGLIYDLDYLKKIVGNSFVVADYCFKNYSWASPLYALHLYSISPYEYLNLFEKYESHERILLSNEKKFGLRLSKDILKNHKDRVLNDPRLYLSFVNFKIVCKNINVLEAKDIIRNLLPNKASLFWNEYGKISFYKELLTKIPQEERFEFIKEIFCKKYVGVEFETDKSFYEVGLYKTMTKQQQQHWASQNIALDNGFFGDTNDYTWYEFIPFEDSFKAIKQTIHKTTDKNRRMKLLLILFHSASNEKEIEIFLKYFYERHINEQFRDKFIEIFVSECNIFTFNNNLWEVLNKLFLVIEGSNKCKTAAVLYRILHDIPLSEPLKVFIKKVDFNIAYLKQDIEKCEPNKEKVINKLVSEIIKNITVYEDNEYDSAVRHELRKVINILQALGKEASNFDIVMKLASLDKDNFRNLFPIKEKKIEDPIRLLKKDIVVANKNIAIINTKFNRTKNQVRLNQILRKLKIYFGNDGSKEWIDYYKNVINNNNSNYNEIYGAIYGIFALGDYDEKAYYINTYVPQSDRIKVIESTDNVEHIQTAICKFIAYCRPFVPLNMITPYIRGDYLKICLPLLEILSANLPPSLCVQFIELLLQKPVSVQKHGLRLAFKKFDSHTLTKIVSNSWQKTKNVSLKNVIFVSLYKYIGQAKDYEIKKQLIDTLKNLMVSLTKDECNEEITSCFKGTNIPDDLKGEFYYCAFNVVEKHKNITGLKSVITFIRLNIHLVGEDLLSHILKDLINASTSDLLRYAKNEQHNENLWELLANYFVKIPSEDVVEQRVQDLKMITSKLIESWDYMLDDVYIIRKLASDFFEKIAFESVTGFLSNEQTVIAVAPVSTLLTMLSSSLPISHIYFNMWRLNLSIIVQETVNLYRKKSEYNLAFLGNVELPKSMMVIIEIGRRLGLLIKQMVDQKQIFLSFLSKMERILDDFISSVYHSCDDLSELKDCLIFLCSGMLEIDVVENYMLALIIIPSYYSDGSYQSQLTAILNKIEAYDNAHLQCMVFQKMYTNFKKAKYY